MNTTGPGRRPRSIIIRRWLRVTSIAFISFAASLLVSWTERAHLEDLGKAPAWFTFLGVSVLLALMCYWGPRHFFAALGLRYASVHPPYWIGLFLGIGSALAAINNIQLVSAHFHVLPSTEGTLDTATLCLLAAPLVAVFISVTGRAFRKGFRKYHWQDRISRKPTDITPRSHKMSRWYHTDAAITSVDDDLFDYEAIAQRMARRLVHEQASAQALLGRLGVGKTTVRYFVEEYLREHYPKAPLTFVAVELWAYETPRAAVEGILRSVVERLSEHVNTSQLNGLPTAYAKAIATATGLAAWIPSVRESTATPFELLEQLDDIATVIDQRIVLWVEDLERFAFGNPAAKVAEASEMERLAPIRALLYGLDRLRSITVVTATTDLFQRFDLEKIARYVERIPAIPYRVARQIISHARTQWMDEAPYIDPLGKQARDKFGWDEQDQTLSFGFLLDSINSLAVAVATLAATPRALKQGLRRCNEAWQHLRGEIDLDDLVAMSMLREAAPDAFAVVENSLEDLRGVVLRTRRQERNPIVEFEKTLTDLGLEERIRQAVLFIVKHVFDKKSALRPQGFHSSNHTDYWRRFLSLPELSEAERDQIVLQVLRSKDDKAIVTLLSDPERSRAVEDFAQVLSPKRLVALFLPLVEARLNENPATWAEDRYPPGLIPYWRMLRDRAGALDMDALVQNIEKGLEIAAPTNLALLEEIVHWMATSSRELVDLLPSSARTRIKQRSRELLQDTYTGKPDLLATHLKNTFPYTLVWLCWGLERIRAQQTRGQPFEGWPQFASTLLQALHVDPEAIATQIAPFIVRDHPRLRGPETWEFDREQCTALFGDPDEFVATMRKAIGQRPTDARVAAVLQQQVASTEDEDVDNSDDYEPAIRCDSESDETAPNE